MPGFRDLRGNELIKERFKREIAAGRLSHAYIIAGEKGIGKKTLAEAVCLSIFCEEPPAPGEACLGCPACKKVLSGSHPDIIYLRHGDESSIKVEKIRKEVVDSVGVRPFYPGRKVYIIADAELMTPGAQNALLKTLEEPPEYVLLLLLTGDETRLIDTVTSRAQTVRMRPLSAGEIREFIAGGQGPDELIAEFSRGLIGRAKELMPGGRLYALPGILKELLNGIGDKSQAEIRSRLKDLKEASPDLSEVPELIELLIKDSLLGEDPDRDKLFKVLRMTETARMRLRAGVNPDLTLLMLFTGIKEI